jgi:hypothetical protein
MISYYADGWVKNVHAVSFSPSSITLDYYPGLGLEYAAIDAERIQSRQS